MSLVTITPSMAPVIVFTGNSLELGRLTTDCMTPITGSGTTSPAYVAAHQVSGRGSLVTQFPMMANNVHLYNFGISGNTIQRAIEAYPQDVGILNDGTHLGVKINIFFDDGNSLGEYGWDLPTLLAKKIEYKALHDADGIRLLWCSGITRKDMYTVAAISGGAISAAGLIQIAANNEERTNPFTYGWGFIDEVANPAFLLEDTPANLASKPCYDTTYFQGGIDRVHNTDAGGALKGSIKKTYLDAHDGLVYPLLHLGHTSLHLSGLSEHAGGF